MKTIYAALIMLLSGCTTFNAVTAPYVTVESGQPYATLSAPANKNIEVMIVYVDGRAAARSIFGEDAPATYDVLVSPGIRKVVITCYYTSRGKYNQSTLQLEVLAGEKYFFTCISNAADTKAEYQVTDTHGNSVPYTIQAIPKK